jgi:hypothetical protein
MGKRSSGERREPAPGSRASETGRRATAARAVAAAAAGKVDLSSGGDAVIGAAEERLGWRDVVTATAEAREGRARSARGASRRRVRERARGVDARRRRGRR